MKNRPGPTENEWLSLYHEAQKFFDLKPWQWMNDNYIFGVYDQETQTVGYCSILGALGEILALAVYPGPRGYFGLTSFQENIYDWASMDDAYSHQYAMMASFEDRAYLDSTDISTIRKLGLNFRGRKAWPQFRFYEPGYLPMSLSPQQTRFLTLALKEAHAVCEEFHNNPDALTQRPGFILVRRPSDNGDVWANVWEPEPKREYLSKPAPVPDSGLADLVRRIPRTMDVWAADIFYLPITIGDSKARPRMPQAFLLIDNKTGLILNFLLEEDHFIERITHTLIHTMRETKTRPQALWVRQKTVALTLGNVTAALGIELREFPTLPEISAARRGLVESLRSGQ